MHLVVPSLVATVSAGCGHDNRAGDLHCAAIEIDGPIGYVKASVNFMSCPGQGERHTARRWIDRENLMLPQRGRGKRERKREDQHFCIHLHNSSPDLCVL